MTEKIYVIGHQSPDLDTVAAAISYAQFKNLLEKTDKYVPMVSGEINKLTKYVLEKFSFKAPQILSDATNKKIILVDHNEVSQMVNGGEKADIVEIIDHHKMNFSYSKPIPILVRAWGSSCSIIWCLFQSKTLNVDENLAGLMLSAILDDTVIGKSPTCTTKDKKIINELSKIAQIDNWQKYGIELFKVKSSVKNMPVAKIIKNDFKDFVFKAGKFGIGQVETVDLSEFDDLHDSLLDELNNLRSAEGYHTVILFITDILKQGSLFLVATKDWDKMTKVWGVEFENNQAYIEGIMSRKKQVSPQLAEIFDK